MGKPVKTVLVQLGEKLALALGAGTYQYQDGLSTSLSFTTASLARCAVSRPLSGSWVVRVDVMSTGASSSDCWIGAIFENARDTMQARRTVNVIDHPTFGLGDPLAPFSSVAMLKNKAVYKDGTSLGLVGVTYGVSDSVWLIYDAAARTMTWRVNNPNTGGYTMSNVTGPLRIALNGYTTNAGFRVVSDFTELTAMNPRPRPAGVWGRLSDIGMTDKVTGAVWEGCIPADSRPSFEQAISHPIMGGRRAGGVGDIVAINARATQLPHLYGLTFRTFDEMLGWDVRDEPYSITVGDIGFDPYLYQLAAAGRVDAISEPSEDRVAISLLDESTLLDVPWQAETYTDGASILPAVIGKTKPTMVGTCKAIPFAAVQLGWAGWDVSDDPVYSVSAVYDQGVAITVGTGYNITTPRTGITRGVNPAGLQCADAVGGYIDTAVCCGQSRGDFVKPAWVGSAPAGWTNGSTGTATVTKVAGGARFLRTGSGAATLNLSGVMGSSVKTVRVDIVASAVASGVLTVAGATGVTAWTLAQVPFGSPGTGLHSFVGNLPAGRPDLRITMTGAGDITIASIRVSHVTIVDKLSDHVTFAATYRGALPSVGASVTAFSGPLSAVSMCYATPMGDRSTVRSVLDRLCASGMAGMYFDSTGKLQIARFRDATGDSPTHAFDDTNIIGAVRVTLDRAPGLSGKAAGVPTWTVHGEQNIAGSLYTTTPGRTLAAALMTEYQVTKTAAGTMASTYDFARDAEPVPTLLAADAGVQAYADEMATLYTAQRRTYQFTGAGDTLPDIGDCVSLDYDGVVRKLMVIGVRGNFADTTFDLTLWG